MTTKLTLTIDDSVIRIAKVYAKKKGRSLSDIIENYLKAISGQDTPTEELSDSLKELMGSFRLSPKTDYKKELGKALAKKYKA